MKNHLLLQVAPRFRKNRNANWFCNFSRIETEDTLEWPRNHRAYLEQLLPDVRKILIIGWQAKEAHFLEMLRDKLPRAGREVERILVVGKDADDGKEILHRFAAELGQSGYNTRNRYTNLSQTRVKEGNGNEESKENDQAAEEGEEA